MNPKNLTDVCVLSENPYFINRVKIFSQNSNISFGYSRNSSCKSTVNLYLIDIHSLESFLKEQTNSNNIKFMVYGQQKDIAHSYSSGCIDFLKDPWDKDELEARILKIIGRTNSDIQWDMLKLSSASLTLESSSIDISIEEYLILKKLLENRGEAVPREALLFALWGKYKDDSRVIDMHISNLRKKILILKKKNKLCCGTIKTVRNYGYMII